ncbi:LysR family transcriptional regulator [Actinokineospora sp. NBRC 105648]|uniref:LysR family transcriptional regulator n=1 Tax=Actinokineospora sp. NBRC 105648 TaxID=3032206 RepID=UPI0024A48FD8|nr:LysR family transcriptional regulator [Actinokineospora sp. NBRC 105648]GLZ38085.1 LysR family transcriptional regulator [Actinokineospora sp. NBRC 105648]
MELHRLRCFLAVAEERGFTRAAARLHVSQPAISQQIRALEKTVGGPLFDRTPTGAALTPAGYALLEPARTAIAVVADGLRAAREAVQGATGPLRVGLIYGGAGVVTQPILIAFADAFPAFRLEFRAELPVAQAYTALLDGEVDVAFTRLPLHPERHAWSALYQEQRVLVVHDNHHLADADSVTLNDVLPLPILSTSPERTPPEVTDHCLLNEFRNGMAADGRITEAWLVPEIAQTVVHNPEVVAMCSEIARRFPPAPGAPLRFLDFPEAGASTAVVARRHDDHRPIVDAFCRFAVAMATSGLVPGSVAGGIRKSLVDSSKRTVQRG